MYFLEFCQYGNLKFFWGSKCFHWGSIGSLSDTRIWTSTEKCHDETLGKLTSSCEIYLWRCRQGNKLLQVLGMIKWEKLGKGGSTCEDEVQRELIRLTSLFPGTSESICWPWVNGELDLWPWPGSCWAKGCLPETPLQGPFQQREGSTSPSSLAQNLSLSELGSLSEQNQVPFLQDWYQKCIVSFLVSSISSFRILPRSSVGWIVSNPHPVVAKQVWKHQLLPRSHDPGCPRAGLAGTLPGHLWAAVPKAQRQLPWQCAASSLAVALVS